MRDATEIAKDIANKFYEGNIVTKTKGEHRDECERAKVRATICLDEMLENILNYNKSNLCNLTRDHAKRDINLFKQVKLEIQEL